MTYGMIVHGHSPTRPRNWLLRAGETQVIEGPVTVNNTGAGRLVVLEVNSDNEPLGPATTEVAAGAALAIPEGALRRLGATGNAALWYDWPA